MQRATDYTEAIRLDPQYATAYYNRGNVQVGQGNLMAAISDYSEAIRLDPQYAAAYNNLGEIHIAQGQFQQALSEISGCAAVYTTNA